MRWIRNLLAALALVALAVGGALAWWLHQPLALRQAVVEVSIEPGTSPREVAQAWVAAGVDTNAQALYWWFRSSGDARRIRAGSYALEQPTSPRELLEMMVRGDQTMQTVRLIEGWNWRQVRQALAQAEHLRPETAGMSDAQVAAALGLATDSPEGRLFPDTYVYSRGVSDLTVLRRAREAMQRRLDSAWAERMPELPLTSPEELLVLASVVEKETGREADRPMVAAVFVNRLRIGMPLQSDPTVIYGLGERFDGNLRKVDLQTDTPYNSYTRRGLPPTPIAMPGLASLRAVARPAASRALYFVARGDGSSVFSDSLSDHNRAVNEFQRRRSP
ncbi:endolytic transglycosylase MltG [Ideonella sp. 4Y16]|uniref:Endolytic murein transglycosylase n=1 Tax=Ideonella alba TaxID=2824118 RepID=A0A940YEA3_9BURK|nr:endolytic transglycosylase MltG [Ideonella alba]MBQ0931002.1 endolytic transglycosylase MltG [Ideonella alba]MBQ0942334.1 endolytic transglycosylase MltG [Ideonella alba]